MTIEAPKIPIDLLIMLARFTKDPIEECILVRSIVKLGKEDQ